MNLNGLKLTFLMLVCSAGVSFGAVYNVKTGYGAAGDGVTDDTVAIRNAINAANNAAGSNTVYFPAGTYLVNDIPITAVSNRGATKLDSAPTDLVFEGDNATESVLKRKSSSSPQQNRIATVENGSTLTFQKLGFDACGIERYGGIAVGGTTNMTVQKVHCFDSSVVGPNGYDRYMFVIQTSTYVNVLDTHWEDLQIEIDNCQHVQVLRNVVERPRETGGIGIWAVGNGYVAEDYLIQDNWIIDPTRVDGGIIVHLDSPSLSNCTFRNIRILNNTIIYPYPAIGTERPTGIKIGTCDSGGTPSNIIFDVISIQDNEIYVDPSVSDTFQRAFIWFWGTYPTSYFSFDNTSTTNNTLYYNGSQGAVAEPYVAATKGPNWVNSGNVKTAYQAPPAVPDPLAGSGTLTTSADARTRCADSGSNYGSENKLCAGWFSSSSGSNAKSWLRFDLASAGITGSSATGVTLSFEMIDSLTGGLGADNANKVFTFYLYGLADGHAGDANPSGWTEGGITWNNAPGNDASTGWGVQSGAAYGGTYLLSFTRTGNGLGTITLDSSSYANLQSFIQADTNGVVTFILTRYTSNSGDSSGVDQDNYIHAVASKEHATAAEPTLTVTAGDGATPTPTSTPTSTPTPTQSPGGILPNADARTRCADSGSNYGSENKLCAGWLSSSSGSNAKSWLRFDLAAAGITGSSATSVTLSFEMIDSLTGGLGADNANKVFTFYLYGLADGHAGDANPSGWTEGGITWSNAPGNDASTGWGVQSGAAHGGTYLLSFTRTGKGLGTITLDSSSYANLRSFIQADTNGVVTFIITRYTSNSGDSSGVDQDNYIHAVASKEHATAAKPALTVTSGGMVPNADARTRCADSGSNYGSETKVCAGWFSSSSGSNAKSWLRFDLGAAGITGSSATSVTLSFEMIDSLTGGLGADNVDKVFTFYLYGLADGHAGDANPSGWTEGGITWSNAPGNDASTGWGVQSGAAHGGTYLLSFTRTGKGLGSITLDSSSYVNLRSFIQADTNGVVTFILTRYTSNSGDSSGVDQDNYIHAVAAKEHTTAAQPTLTVQ